ncbi:melanoma-associated antigen 10-like [Octodon degus]|uniref:Melanoma-associated antigen 10-like n=1 Tax=Octodon degus TaxID=10160 RepID=A0A6P3FXH4_OCTDE|nr:melanoma-associated antigen 10-like [Octodon degus]
MVGLSGCAQELPDGFWLVKFFYSFEEIVRGVIMPGSLERSQLTDKQDDEDTAGLGPEQIPSDEEEEDSMSVSSFHFSFPSSSSSPRSSLSYFSLNSVFEEDEEMEEVAGEPNEKEVQEEELLAADVICALQSPPQIAAGSHPSPASCSMLDEASNSTQDKDTGSFVQEVLDKKVAELVQFFLLKYQTKELITKAEMLNDVIKEYTDHFPVIVGKARAFTELVFGIVVKELGPKDLIYISYSTVDLTYHGMLKEYQSPSKTSLLLFVLGMILMDGDCMPEEKFWEVLNALAVYAEREHVMYGDARMLISDWVQKSYLMYKYVPNSDPKCYTFHWGPRAHAEVSEGKIWALLAKLKGIMLSSFPAWYKDGLKNVREPSL